MLKLKEFLQKCHILLESIIMDSKEAGYIRHNQKVWGNESSNNRNGEILIESCRIASSIISFSYLANVLASIHNATIKTYVIRKKSLITKLLSYKTGKMYRSFNTEDVIYFDLSQAQSLESEKMFNIIYPQLKDKKSVEDLKIDGVWIGDLLYDSHCMNYKVPTIDIRDKNFCNSLMQAISYYIFWRDYLDAHNVKSVVLTHTVYYQVAIIGRLAIHRKIPVYQINATHLYYLNENNIMAYTDFFYFPEYFRALSKEEQQKGLQMARERLEKRMSGEVGVDMHYSTKSAYGSNKNNKVLKESPRTKILIATHCFFDNPHPYGVNLFPDFYEWLVFLGEISEKTDYDWYIKTHPDFLPGNIPIIEEFIRKYPKFTLIPSETSHLQLIEEGINFALTVYGTIGFEYAALGIPVVNASLCNARIRYNINFHPKSIEEYEGILLTLPEQKLNIDMNEVYEAYYMFYLNRTDNWLFSDYEGFLKKIGGYYKQTGPVSYKEFMEEFSQQRHNEIQFFLKRFVNSKEYYFKRSHMVNHQEIDSNTVVAERS
jgi:hypothetical protein